MPDDTHRCQVDGCTEQIPLWQTRCDHHFVDAYDFWLLVWDEWADTHG
jgi:hypothetical protein